MSNTKYDALEGLALWTQNSWREAKLASISLRDRFVIVLGNHRTVKGVSHNEGFLTQRTIILLDLQGLCFCPEATNPTISTSTELATLVVRQALVL